MRENSPVNQDAPASPSLKLMLQTPLHLLSFGFGSGLSPIAPGTMGSLAALPLWLLLVSQPLVVQLLFIALCFAVGVYCCERTSQALGVDDHGAIVWDEFVGQWLCLLFAPLSVAGFAAAFVLFRLFDIAKPWPVGWVDRRFKGGLGVMLDDVAAALYAIAGLLSLRYTGLL